MLYLTLLTQPPSEDGEIMSGLICCPIATASRFTVLGALVAFFTGDLPPAQLRDILTPLLVHDRAPDTVEKLDRILTEAKYFPKWGKDIEIFRDAGDNPDGSGFPGRLEICKAARVVAVLGENSEAPVGHVKSL